MNHEDMLLPSGDTGLLSEINVTPFIDVMLVLLIIFMVTAPMMLSGVNVNLPKSQLSPLPRPETPLVVSIDAHNQVFIDEKPMDKQARTPLLRQLATRSATGEVYVRGDGDIRYARLIELMTELGQAGFSRVTLVTVAASPDVTPPSTTPDAVRHDRHSD